ncbi:hypothetical protein [Sphingopyxis sp. LC363]|jgi:hypothetical protein|uniref:hypothetical protein n=1 Tax=Sphingopyxis sp. LC363 TaxID=1120705 RepID=UPI00050F9A46|nr:hypothetical protein [Sphingopyxis sp. LC363]KGB54730.1 hypothetical protein FG95_02922 [Sphingopyxis sp. LC363]
MNGKTNQENRTRICPTCHQPLQPLYVASEFGPLLRCECGLRPLIGPDEALFRYSGVAAVVAAVALFVALWLFE